MLSIDNPQIAQLLFKGRFGLEKESLRITRTGANAHTPHPFDHPCIVQDFCENQTEINTPVCETLEQAMDQMTQLSCSMNRMLQLQQEVLWPFSSPAAIESEEDIETAYSLVGEQGIAYRRYLSSRYGRYQMTFSGIHFNCSLSDALLRTQALLDHADDYRTWKDHFYLQLAAKAAKYGWLIGALLNASPLLDGSYWEKHLKGSTCFTGMASMRNSTMGYWNFFTPVFDYSSMENYADSIDAYCRQHYLFAASELYYPVRLKPAGKYSPDHLRLFGADHIELRMIDLNPYEISGLAKEDAAFCHLFLVWLACLPDEPAAQEDQILYAQNFKNAAHYDLKTSLIIHNHEQSSTVWDAAWDLLNQMEQFVKIVSPEKTGIILHQKKKLLDPQRYRLAWNVRRDFGDDYLHAGLAQALRLQKQA